MTIQVGLEAFNLPYQFSNETPADGNCFAHAIVDQVQLKEHWDTVLPRARIQDIKVFKESIVDFIRNDHRLNQDIAFQEAKTIMVNENLKQRQPHIYGNLSDEQAYQVFKHYLDLPIPSQDKKSETYKF